MINSDFQSYLLELLVSEPPEDQLTPDVGPGTTDVPTVGSTPLRHEPRHHHAIVDTEDHPSSEMLKHLQNLDLRSDFYQHDNGQTALHPRHSSGCDDSGVFLEDAIASSPETKLRSSGPNMRQFSVHDDSDAERSDDLGLASSSIDSADDLDGDPLPSTLKIEPPAISDTWQKPPPIPARKPYPKTYCNELTTELLLPKRPLLDKTSSLESNGSDSKSNEMRYNVEKTITLKGASRSPVLSQQKHMDSFVARSFEEDNRSNDSKSNFLARTLNPSSYLKPEQSSNLKWKSEECLRTAAEVKWSLSGRRNEKSVSVKDRIAMFSEMEASQTNLKKDDTPNLHRYGSENNIKGIPATPDRKIENETNLKSNGFGVDSKWHSMQSITPSRKSSIVEKDLSPSHILPTLTAPPTVPSGISDNINGAVNCCTLPLKLDVEPPKPIVSTYPETQLTNNKRYNYGLYSLKNLKNTEDLLSKKISGNGLLSIIENRKQPLPKLKGLVIPEKLPLANHSKALPTIVTTKSDDPLKDYRRCSLPATIVTTCNTISRSKLEERERLKQNALVEPPWKSNGSSSNTLPKYSPAFKRRTLELPGSSLSPTPPSSITSPLSPPPSSPSSICSSNASSSLQQNVFQFSLSHSKPVTPLLPEKAVMSPPSLPSDVEYEGDNSEDSSTSASPMLRDTAPKENPKLPPQNNGSTLHYERSNTFTSSARSVSLQPMVVETLAKVTDKSPVVIKETNGNSIDHHSRSEVYLSKAEILLKKDDRPRSDLPLPPKTPSCAPVDYLVMRNHTASYILAQNGKPEELPGGKFRAQPIETPSKTSQNSDEHQWRRPCDDSEDEDDSHSTLSHRTEDSRHTTTDECLSDATTDSFDKPVRMVKNVDGYLSDATNESVDVSLGRYQTRGSVEECLSDATTDSADWCPRARMGAKDHGSQRCSDDGLSDNSLDPDLRPRRLSQQRTVLKAQLEPSGSVQKFKALAEKWEHRTDVTSPTPPPTQPPPIPAKRDARSNSIAAAILSTSTSVSKNNQSSLPPSLMPRNSVSEKKGPSSPPSRPPPREPRCDVLQNGLPDIGNRITKSERALGRNGFLDDEVCGLSRLESSQISRTDSSSSGSSKTTLKDEEDFRPMKPMMRQDRESFDGASNKGLAQGRHKEPSLNNNLSRSQTDISKTFSLKKGNSLSVSDLLRSFENQTGGKDTKPAQQKKLSISEAPALLSTTSVEHNHRPAKSSECTLPADEMMRLMEAALIELADDKMEVLVVVLRREGGGGGSVGLTLAGGADYEVKEITVHKVISGGLADRDGRICKGDRVLSINGHSLKGVSHGEALRILKAPSSRVVLTLARDKQMKDAQSNRQASDRIPLQGTDGVFQIELQKDSAGLGFSIEGGKHSPSGDKPLLIKRIFKGGVTDKSGQLDEGDELLSAAGQSFANMTRTEAWNYLKKLPFGPVVLKARKANS